MTRRRPGLVVAAVLLAVLADAAVGACASLPRMGAVHSRTVTDPGDADALVDYTPAGPRKDTTPVPLVDNFLTAMTATPLNTYVAREFLTDASSPRWVPERGTVVYGGVQVLDGRPGEVTVRLRDVVELDERGSWRGDPTRGRGHDYTLHVVKEEGQWRIVDPPDRLLIPRAHFDTQYQQFLLYFFDMSDQVLVPEPVYAPRGRQAPTMLAADLMRGPEPSLAQVERSSFPKGTSLDGISVPVSRSGTAEVPLSHRILDASDRQLDRSLAQLAWTLGQVPGVRRLRVTVDGASLDRPAAGQDLPVDGWPKVDPAVSWASTSLYGLRAGRVTVVGSHGEGELGGPLADLGGTYRTVAVDLFGQRVAAVTTDGGRVVETAHDASQGQPARPDELRTVYRGGEDVLRPVYDLYGQLWVLDRRRDGTRVTVLADGVARRVVIPGLTDAQVTRAVLARDGSRLALVVRRAGADSVVVCRVRRDTAGRVRGLTTPVRLSLAGSPVRVEDLAWRTPSTLGALVQPASGISQVLVARVDGSDETGLDTDAQPFRGKAVRLLTGPALRMPLVVATSSGATYSLSQHGWLRTPLPSGTTAPSFAG